MSVHDSKTPNTEVVHLRPLCGKSGIVGGTGVKEGERVSAGGDLGVPGGATRGLCSLNKDGVLDKRYGFRREGFVNVQKEGVKEMNKRVSSDVVTPERTSDIIILSFQGSRIGMCLKGRGERDELKRGVGHNNI